MVMNEINEGRSTKEVRYALVTPVRDEELYIGAMIDSVLAQQTLPAKWVIVDDGSTDKTADIITDYARQHAFIELVRLPVRAERMPGGEGALAQALRRLNLAEYDFFARFDADLIFEPDYMAQIFSEFSADPTLGIAGGGLYVDTGRGLELERVPDYHVRGALKMYRRECSDQIGGLTSRIGWDTIDEVSAWTRGWKTRSFFQNRVRHCRPTGKGLRCARVYWERGKAEYYTWSHPLFVLAKTLKLGAENFSVLKPLSFLAGFASCYVNRETRLQDPGFVKTRHSQQWERIAAGLRIGPHRNPSLPD